MKKFIIVAIVCVMCMLTTTAAGVTESVFSLLTQTESVGAARQLSEQYAVDIGNQPSEGRDIGAARQSSVLSAFEAGKGEHIGKLYGIGSVSKVFTAAAVMKLVDDGLLDLDEPLVTYMPDFTMADERYTLITARMLLNHSSGLMGMTAINVFLVGDNDAYLHDHFLAFLKNQTLKHNPGDRSIYSNDGFTLAEILVERVSGMSFTDFIFQYFKEPLGLENIETPQSDFDRDKLAYTYLGNNELKPQRIGMIGSGGVYATMEDLCRFATIFMDDSDGAILSRTAVDEMSKIQHKMEIVAPDKDTVFRYGLGWDCVEQYPFNLYGVRALSKGGATQGYYTNLTVLPEYNLAASVASSGDGGMESLIAQEIILSVLQEEGLIPKEASVTLPEQNLNRASIPEEVKSRAGVYAAGTWGQFSIEFIDDSLIMTPISERNERSMAFIYNTDGEFVSVNGDFIGFYSQVPGAVGVTALTFADNYLVIQSYESMPGLSCTAVAMPYAEKIMENPVSGAVWDAWTNRNDKEYLLASEKDTSALYITMPILKTIADERAYGYVTQGVYASSGAPFPAVRIADEFTALGYQNTPTMTGRDVVDLNVEVTNGVEYLHMNNSRYVEASSAAPLSSLGETVIMGDDPVWADIDDYLSGKKVTISITSAPSVHSTPIAPSAAPSTPLTFEAPVTTIMSSTSEEPVTDVETETGSWFIYDDKMNCIATSLEMKPRASTILPEGGRIVLVGKTGTEFVMQMM